MTPKALKLLLPVLFMFAPLSASSDDRLVSWPEVVVGDRWTYRMLDEVRSPTPRIITYQVTATAQRAIQTLVSTGERETDITFSPEWNAIAGAFGVYEPSFALLQFPLKQGTTWESEFDSTFGSARSSKARHKIQARVVGWEDIAVPAGRFHAVRIEGKGEYSRVDRLYLGTTSFTFWYAPEVRRWVKRFYEDRGLREVNSKISEELLEYSVK